MLTNAGTKVHPYQGRVPVFNEPVWFDPMAITNNMSLNSLKRDHRDVYDQKADSFTIYDRKTAKIIAVFESNEKGVYLFTSDTNSQRDRLTLYQDTRSDHLMNHDTNLLATVKENAGFYTAQQLKSAKRARELYHILGAPCVPTFKSMLQMNTTKNCPKTSSR